MRWTQLLWPPQREHVVQFSIVRVVVAAGAGFFQVAAFPSAVIRFLLAVCASKAFVRTVQRGPIRPNDNLRLHSPAVRKALLLQQPQLRLCASKLVLVNERAKALRRSLAVF
eukprot:m.90837 g.90837  ORF g.90837 m.90837 type:complete len:112 (+) comp8578_c0_seq1:351-686(+)